MSNKQSILIVDNNVAFATILKEGLEQGGEYHATVTGDGDEALQALSDAEFDLVIVDMGLTDPDGATLARTLRQQNADLRLMLIPLMGEELSPEVADLDIQGVLSKPFFFPELPGIISGALEQNVGEAPSVAAEPAAAEPLVSVTPEPPLAPAENTEPDTPPTDRLAEVREGISEKRMQRITQAMTGLTQEVNAEAVILTCKGGLIAYAGRLPAEKANELAQVVGENWHTSARVARILDREQLGFEQSVEGGEHMFYSLAVVEDIILSAALSTGVPLGMIRHRAKATADALRRLIGQG